MGFINQKIMGLRFYRYLGISLTIVGLTWLLSGFSIIAFAQG